MTKVWLFNELLKPQMRIRYNNLMSKLGLNSLKCVFWIDYVVQNNFDGAFNA